MKKIIIYKKEKLEKADYDYLIEFPSETSVISLEETIQLLFVMDKDLLDTKKILNVCRPWNYVRVVVYEGGLEENYLEHYEKISKFQPTEGSFFCDLAIFNIRSLYFEEPELKGNKDIELIKNSIPHGIMPVWEFRERGGRIYGSFRKKGWLVIFMWKNKVKLEYNRGRRLENYDKGYYIYTYNNIQEALPEINKLLIEKLKYI